MRSDDESGFDDFVDAVMEFVGDEEVQRGAGFLILGGVAIGILFGVYLIVKMYYVEIFTTIFIIGALMLWLKKEPIAYCQDCGNTLGRGEPSRPCSRCKCNRWSYSDPGVGMTIKNR